MSTSIGYEHLKSIYFLKDAQAKAPLAASSAYILPLMAMQSARLAIEEYVNSIGRKVDKTWDEINWLDVPIQEQLAHLFQQMGYTLNPEKNVWKEVLSLFAKANSIQGNLAEMQKLYREEIPEQFKDLAVEYPIYRSQVIAEEAIDILLDMSDVSSTVKMGVSRTK